MGEYHKKYYIKNKKNYIIPRWKNRGCRDADFPALLEYYMNATECMICFNKFNNNIWDAVKCLDHDHETGEVRYIACSGCNLTVLARPNPRNKRC